MLLLNYSVHPHEPLYSHRVQVHCLLGNDVLSLQEDLQILNSLLYHSVMGFQVARPYATVAIGDICDHVSQHLFGHQRRLIELEVNIARNKIISVSHLEYKSSESILSVINGLLKRV